MLPILKYLYVSNLDFKSAVGYNQKIIGQAIGLASQQNSCDLIFFDIDGSVMLEIRDPTVYYAQKTFDEKT